MPAVPSTREQVRAYRFGLRRLDSALQSGDPLPSVDPSRRTRVGLSVGLGAVALLVLASAIYGLIRPRPTIGDAVLVRDKDSGAVYVVRDGRLYPAVNLASALLAAGSAGRTPVKTVDAATLQRYPRGPLIGIPGAPDSVVSRADVLPARWAACDHVGIAASPQVTTLVGLDAAGELDPGQAVLVRGPDGAYALLTRSARVPVSADPRVFRALGIDAAQARPTSSAVLDAIPDLPGVAAPVVPSAGRRPSYDLAGRRVGSVVRVERAATFDYYLLLRDGLQPITPLMADLVRFTYAAAARIAPATPSEVGRVPATRSPLPLPALRSAPTLAPAAPVICVSWHSRWVVSAHARLPLPAGASAAGGVYVPSGRGAVVAAVSGTAGAATASRFLVTDEGIRYPIPDESVLGMLGLGGSAQPLPAALVALLPLGPTLDPAKAKASWTTPSSPTTVTDR